MTTALAFLVLSCSSKQSPIPRPSSPGLSQDEGSPSPVTSLGLSQDEGTAVPPTSTPASSPVPFRLYGETAIDMYYCTMDGLPLKMDLYFPESGGPWPALVYVHGGSWRGGDKSEAVPFADRMRAQGYLVVSINYRLPPAGRFPAMIEDVKCAVRYLRANAAQYNLDPGRIAAAGTSAGGHLVALLGTTDATAGWDVGEYLEQSSRVQAVIAIAPVTDLTKNFPDLDLESMREVGFKEDNIVQASPVTYVTPDDPPLLLIHGDQDEVVPPEQSQLMYDRLVEVNVPAQLVIVKNAGHSPIEPDGPAEPSLDQIYQIISDFLAKYLA